MSVYRIAVEARRPELDSHGAAVLGEIHDRSLIHVTGVASSRLFLLEGLGDQAAAERIAAELLADPVTERYTLTDAAGFTPDARTPAVEVHFKPGVMDPVAASTRLAVRDFGIDIDDAQTARRYVIDGAASLDELRDLAARILYNDCIERAFFAGFGHADAPPAGIPRHRPYSLELRHQPIRELDDEGLERLSRDAHLFLSLAEMQAIRDHYRNVGREPTDVELETLAQTWSEHCVHKTLKSAIEYRGAAMPAASPQKGEPNGDNGVVIRYDNLLARTIAAATHALTDPEASRRDGREPISWCLSVFEDNAGIITFDDDFGVAFKVETHNHPSAIEPYGGAATGVGGCIRDVIGCGLGAKPIANTDVFCFAPPDLAPEAVPKGVLHPRRVMRGVVAGVRDYGNRMGIPTVNGAIHFDRRYLGNPLVFCGCVGLIPRDLIKKAARPGDVIVVAGGRTGRDGIHGATFSSAELTDGHAEEFSHAVQIGNAITEKTMLDTLLQARDHSSGCLYTGLTDCGAGGLSSAVGEMGEHIGALVHLERVPLKYEGLRYDEIWISEAQERMVMAVPPENVDTLLGIFEAEDVEATVIGSFTDGRALTLQYDGTQVGELEMEFLHDGLPKTTRVAEWQPPADGRSACSGWPTSSEGTCSASGATGSLPASASAEEHGRASRPWHPERTGADVVAELKRRLSDLDTASKEWVIRQYDHEVQGGSVVKPLAGPGDGPSDAAVVRPRLDSQRGVAIGCGMCPGLADVDPYWMAAAAVDEAVRNVVCTGGDPARTAILDNFCWGNCTDPQTLGGLVRACQGAHDAAMAYRVPFISGKDSLNNEFSMDPQEAKRLGFDRATIAIPATLLVSAVSIVDDVTQCATMDLKAAGDYGSSLWLVGLPFTNELGFDFELAAKIHRAIADAIRRGLVLAAHDCSEGGLAVAVAEMAIAGNAGAWIHDLPGLETQTVPDACSRLWSWPKELSGHELLFSEGAGRYVIESRPKNAAALRELLADVPWIAIGGTRSSPTPELSPANDGERGGPCVAVADLREAWQSPLRW